MDCGTTLVKYILFIFNTLVSILGILAIVYGALVLKSIGIVEYEGQVGFPPQAAMPIGLITIGSIVLFISFLGCCGAIREDVCMTMCYAVFMLLLLIVQLIIVVLLWTQKDKITDAIGNVIDEAWKQNEASNAGVFEGIQKSLKCCGSKGPSDYVLSAKVPPPSCCPNDSCTLLNYYGGCKKEFIDLMSGSTEKTKFFGLGLIVVELVGFIFACCLANNVRNYKRRNDY